MQYNLLSLLSPENNIGNHFSERRVCEYTRSFSLLLLALILLLAIVLLLLLFFRNALEHLSRLSRILSTPSGCALLVGVNGTGRQSLTYLAADIYSQGVFKPEISNNYGKGNPPFFSHCKY